MTHKQELENVRKLVHALGGKCNVLAQSARLRGSPGIPDLYCHVRRFTIWERFWCEIKVPPDKLSPAQVAFKACETECGGVVIVGGVAEVAAYLGVQVT